jgi:proline-specific peptidase
MDDPVTGAVSAEGRLAFREWYTWYEVVGDVTDKTPLVVLHGGPGIPHEYLDPLAALAHDGRAVVFYDQLGCGDSTPLHDPLLWTVDLFVEQLDDLRRQLALERVHVLGQSWGGMLALDYALHRPSGLASLILADTSPSMPAWIRETARLRRELPQDVQDVLDRCEAEGDLDGEEYQAALMAFYERHVCRVPWPEYVKRAFAEMEEDPEVYFTMWGPNEFNATGTLRTWDVTARLGEIDAPTLVLCGRHDEATPALAELLREGIAGAQLHVFKQSSHFPHVEEQAAFLAAVDEFLDGVDGRR